MPDDWEDKGPSPMDIIQPPIPLAGRATRELAWHQRQREAGRAPQNRTTRVDLWATQPKDGTWEGPYHISCADDFLDTLPKDWVDDTINSSLVSSAMALDSPSATPLTQTEPVDQRPQLGG